MFSKILVAVDDSAYSDEALRYGVMLAKQFKADIALVHSDEVPVNTPYVADPMLTETPLLIPEMMQLQEEASRALFERLEKQYAGQVEFTAYSKVGRAKDQILDAAEEYGADLIILGTHGRTGFDHLISGSVSESVARRSKCPVMIIPRGSESYGVVPNTV